MNLSINNLQKSFKSKKALNNFTSYLSSGVYGLLGPNGSGKTTFISILVGILKEDSGSILYDGKNVKELGLNYIEKIGYLPQYPIFYKNFKAYEFLEYMCELKDVPVNKRKERIESLLKTVNLWEDKNNKISSFSGGMRQRLGIAQAMLNNPEILILDEPTAGLDPKERIRFRNLISKFSKDRIVILSTHIVSDVEYIAKEVILLKDGHMIKQKTPMGLIKELENHVWLVTIDEDRMEEYIERYSISNVVRENDLYKLRIISSDKPSKNAESTKPNLEDVFMYYFEGGGEF
ncbi:ABC transporter ATP-binding protein [Hathewaya massiliensis]|uniref:ABC transporter ATP-binding protein n=1 Tax=Hathewaya massiliensis TaxID=1964382 RepID=UPI0011585026|nr:ABC transporter ATP-binding protein [Hathewaya massiliensis]